MAPRFFYILFALFFCLCQQSSITGADESGAGYITYDALSNNEQYTDRGSIIYGHRRLLHLQSPSHPSAVNVGMLIKTACRDNMLDYLGTLCSDVLRSAPVKQQRNVKRLARFALQQTEKLVLNASMEVKQGLVAHGHGMQLDLSVAFKSCENTWYPQVRHDINVAIIQLTAKDVNAKFHVVDALNGASTKIRSCFYDLSSKKFVQGEGRVMVNKINGNNQLLRRLLAASDYLVSLE